MEWERKFYDIVRETEANLDNARRKLKVRSTDKNIHADPLSFEINAASSLPPPSPLLSSNDHINSLRQTLHSAMANPARSQVSPLPASCHSLVPYVHSSSEKRQLQSQIDSQNLMIQKLERLVHSLNQEKEVYRQQVAQLQNDMGQMSSQLQEPPLESRMDLMRHEVRSDMQRIHSLLHANTASSRHSHTLERSLRDMQDSVHRELQELRQDLYSMTHRVGKLELDLSSQSASQRNLQHRLTNVHYPIASYCGLGLHNVDNLLNKQLEITQANSAPQLTDIRSTVSQLHSKLDSLENRLSAGPHSLPATAPPSLPAHHLSRHTSRKLQLKTSRPQVNFYEDENDNYGADEMESSLSDLLDLDLSHDSQVSLADDLNLSDDDLEDIVNGKGNTLHSSNPASRHFDEALSDERRTAYDLNVLSGSSEGSHHSETGLELLDLGLDNLDLSTSSDPADLDLDEAESDDLGVDSDDLKVDDL